MSGQNIVNLKGTLLAGPPRSSTNAFPSGIANAPFELRPPNKGAAVSSGLVVRNLASPSSFVELGGVGDDQAVTQATMLYFRTTAKIIVRLTMQGDSGDQIATLYVDGLLIQEFPTANYLKLIEAEGTGMIEYFASGNQ